MAVELQLQHAFDEARQSCTDNWVQVRWFKSNPTFNLPFYDAPDGRRVWNVDALVPGKWVYIREVVLSGKRIVGKTRHWNGLDLCVNLRVLYNRKGEASDVWYVTPYVR